MLRTTTFKVLVTGGTSGIGARITERLLERGHCLILASRRVSETRPSDTSQNSGGRLCQFHVDVASWESVQSLATRLRETHLSPDVIVHAAGLQGEVQRLADADPQNWKATVEGNLVGTFHLLKAFWSDLHHGGRFLAFSGGGATAARTRFSAYGCAKAGVVRLIEMADAEAKEEGALSKFFAIAPGALSTAMTEEVIRLGPERAGVREFESAQRLLATGTEGWKRALDGLTTIIEGGVDALSGRLLALQWDELEATARAIGQNPAVNRDTWQLRRVAPEWTQRKA